MANGHVEIHDVLSGHGAGLAGPTDPESPDAGSMEDSVELRLMMAYAKRRRPAKAPKPPCKDDPTPGGGANGSPPAKTDTEEKRTMRKKKKKGLKPLLRIFKCVKPQTEESEEPQPMVENRLLVNDRPLHPEAPEQQQHQQQPDEAEDDDPLAVVARRLMALADDVPLVPPDIEADAPPEVTGSHSREVEAMIGLLLRESGDRLYEKELKDANIAAELFWNYGFFRSLMNAVLTRMGLRSRDPDAPGPQASPKTQIAVACEITSRLTAVETLPMSRLLDHGARYLQDFYLPWARQQGGYEAAFQDDDDDDDDEVQ